MAMKTEVKPSYYVSADTYPASLKVVLKDVEGDSCQTIATFDEDGVTLYPLSQSHKETPVAAGFRPEAFDDRRVIKVHEECGETGFHSIRRVSFGPYGDGPSHAGKEEARNITYSCSSGDGSEMIVTRLIRKRLHFVPDDGGVSIVLDEEDLIRLRDQINATLGS